MNHKDLKMGATYRATHEGQKGFLFYREALAHWAFEIPGQEPVELTEDQLAAISKISKV